MKKSASLFDSVPYLTPILTTPFRKWRVRKWLRVYQRGYTHIGIRAFTYYVHEFDARAAFERGYWRGRGRE